MKSLRDAVKNRSGALGHFNVSDSNQLEAVARASKETNLPVIVGLSEGERDFFPLTHVRALIHEYNKEGTELYLNADHTYSIEKVRTAIQANVDSIVVDGAKLSFEENVSFAKEAKTLTQASGHDIIVEGELGYIGTSSKVLDALPEGVAITEAMMTKPEELKDFVQKTGIDMVAPSVGNVHGIVKSGEPKLSITRIKALASAAAVPLVLHGGSGNSDEEYTEGIRAGIAIIHINTELRLAYRHGLETAFKNQDEIAPYKFLAPSVLEMKNFLVKKMKLFAGA